MEKQSTQTSQILKNINVTAHAQSQLQPSAGQREPDVPTSFRITTTVPTGGSRGPTSFIARGRAREALLKLHSSAEVVPPEEQEDGRSIQESERRPRARGAGHGGKDHL